MKVFKFFLPTIAAMLSLMASAANAAHPTHPEEPLEQDESPYQQQLNEKDVQGLREYLKEKREEEIAKNPPGTLTISGDVRTEWRNMTEKSRGRKLRGSGAVNLRGLPVSKNDFDIECNIRFDYKTPNTWSAVQLQFDNPAGVEDNEKSCEEDPEGYHGSGHGDNICLKKAFMGGKAYSCGDAHLDIELGRRGNLYNVFESEIQFLSRLDGIVFKYADKWNQKFDWYWTSAGFVVDERVNHFAWITEVGLLKICDTGFGIKYSFINWPKLGINRCFVHNPDGFKFRNSQIYVEYNLDPKILNIPVQFFGAFLCNHDAYKIVIERPGHRTKRNSENLGGYVGIWLNRIEKAGDWEFEVQYQIVQANAMPDDDQAGIGRGNVLDESFTASRRGNTNFKGWKFEGLYALTDQITLDSIILFSWAADPRIGGTHHYSKYELEAIYAF